MMTPIPTHITNAVKTTKITPQKRDLSKTLLEARLRIVPQTSYETDSKQLETTLEQARLDSGILTPIASTTTNYNQIWPNTYIKQRLDEDFPVCDALIFEYGTARVGILLNSRDKYNNTISTPLKTGELVERVSKSMAVKVTVQEIETLSKNNSYDWMVESLNDFTNVEHIIHQLN